MERIVEGILLFRNLGREIPFPQLKFVLLLSKVRYRKLLAQSILHSVFAVLYFPVMLYFSGFLSCRLGLSQNVRGTDRWRQFFFSSVVIIFVSLFNFLRALSTISKMKSEFNSEGDNFVSPFHNFNNEVGKEFAM